MHTPQFIPHGAISRSSTLNHLVPKIHPVFAVISKSRTSPKDTQESLPSSVKSNSAFSVLSTMACGSPATCSACVRRMSAATRRLHYGFHPKIAGQTYLVHIAAELFTLPKPLFLGHRHGAGHACGGFDVVHNLVPGHGPSGCTRQFLLRR